MDIDRVPTADVMHTQALMINEANEIIAKLKRKLAAVERPTMGEGVVCPFCGEGDFDLIGLKAHLHTNCEEFEHALTTYEERIAGELEEK